MKKMIIHLNQHLLAISYFQDSVFSLSIHIEWDSLGLPWI